MLKSELCDKLLSRAAQEDAIVTSSLEDLAKKNNGRMEGLAYLLFYHAKHQSDFALRERTLYFAKYKNPTM